VDKGSREKGKGVDCSNAVRVEKDKATQTIQRREIISHDYDQKDPSLQGELKKKDIVFEREPGGRKRRDKEGKEAAKVDRRK